MSGKVTQIPILGKPCIALGNGVSKEYLYNDINSFVNAGTRIVIITDSNVYSIYGSRFIKQFQESGTPPLVIVIQPGEMSKCYEVKQVCNK